VKEFDHMFYCECDGCDSCSKFNQDLSSWKVNQATDMASMFSGANSFDQDLGWTLEEEKNGFFQWHSRDNNVFKGTKCEADDCGVTFETDPIADAETEFCEESGFTKSECRSHDCCFWGSGSKTCLWSRYNAGKCTQTRLDVTAADARGAGAFSTLLLVGSMLLIAGFIVARKATRSAENEPLLATTA